MSKAILVMDMPETCENCPALFSGRFCKVKEPPNISVDSFLEKKKPDWCPLREIPEKKGSFNEEMQKAIENGTFEGEEPGEYAFLAGTVTGYNSCIDEILGGAV